jgi:hypothetical protein
MKRASWLGKFVKGRSCWSLKSPGTPVDTAL